MRQEIRAGLAGTIGNTPLIRLRRASDATGCEILGKAEFLNPGGSVKDRAARGILDDAERRGLIEPGGTLVEGTAGNTGIGFAHLCNARGYRCVIVMPDNQSPEKAALLRTLGADVRIVRTVPYSDPDHYQKLAPRIGAELGAAVGNQFDNTANRDAHYATTGPEIWRDTEGRIDAFTCATGTGGTLGGVSRYLKEQKPGVRIVLADPLGSALHHWVKHGELKSDRFERRDRGHRHRPRDGESRRLAHRRRGAGRRPGHRAHDLRAAARRGPVPRQHQRHQRRRRHPRGTRPGAGSHRRDHAVRRRIEVPLEVLRSATGSRRRGSRTTSGREFRADVHCTQGWVALPARAESTRVEHSQPDVSALHEGLVTGSSRGTFAPVARRDAFRLRAVVGLTDAGRS